MESRNRLNRFGYQVFLCLFISGSTQASSFTKGIDVKEKAKVEIFLKTADLSVSGWDKAQIKIEASQPLPVFVEEEGSLVKIGKKMADDPRGLVRIFVPTSAELSIKTIGGDFLLNALKGRARIVSVSGNVIVEGCEGGVDVKTVSGDISMKKIKNNVEGKTVSGDFKVDDFSGRAVQAKSVSGDIELKSVTAQDVRLTTHSGDIVVRGEIGKEGKLVSNTFSGDINIFLPKTTSFSLLAATKSGDIETNFHLNASSKTENSLQGRVGDAQAEVNLNCFSGDIRLFAE